MVGVAKKWGKFFDENVALDMLMKIIDDLDGEEWIQRDKLVTTLRKYVKKHYSKDYAKLGDADYGNMIDWLSARYTQIDRMRPILKKLETFVEKYERQKMLGKWAYRKRVS
ncbi:MAG: hypothetical protein HXX80_00360 [Nitrososphaerales archaeon]|nr:hypothetical protein [Nitrososphaerales archaeon]